jgi:hypothetical protein
MQLYQDIIINVSEYLDENEIIHLSRTCKQYYDICNKYSVMKYYFDNLPFGISYRIRHNNKIEKPLFAFGYCKKWINYISTSEKTMLDPIIDEEEILQNSDLVVQRCDFIGGIGNGRVITLDYKFVSMDPYIIGITDIELIIIFNKNIDTIDIFIPYIFNLGLVSDMQVLKINYHHNRILHNKNIVCEYNKLIYPIIFGSNIIPILYGKLDNGKLQMRLPNFDNLDINIINAYVNIKNIFPKKEIRDLIFVNKMINLLFRCIDKKITPIFQTIKIVMIFSDIIKRTKIFQYKFYFENITGDIIKEPIFDKLIFYFGNGSNICYYYNDIANDNGEYTLYFANKKFEFNSKCYKLYDKLPSPIKIIFFLKSINYKFVLHETIKSISFLLHNEKYTDILCLQLNR